MPTPSRSLWLLVLTVGAYGITLLLIFLLTADWQARQTWAVVLTGLAVIWYTWETYQLRQTSQAQVSASEAQVALAREQLTAMLAQTASMVRPFVAAWPEDAALRLENLGSGPALNVRVRQFAIETNSENWRLTVDVPDSVPVLVAGSQQVRPVTLRLNGKPMATDFSAHISPDYAVASMTIEIEYESIDHRRYVARQRIAPKTLQLLGYDDVAV